MSHTSISVSEPSDSAALTIQSTVRLSSGYEMPLLGLGVFENDHCAPAVETALRYGYRLVDSAKYYRNEAEVAKGVQDSGVPRGKVFITSKIYDPHHGYESTFKAVHESLEKFGYDYIDLYLIHSPLSGKQRRLDTWRALLDLQKQGKLRTVGVSNYGVHHLEEIRAAGLDTPAVNQIEIHPYCQQRSIVEYCRQHGIVVQAYCPLVRGQFNDPLLRELSDKYNKDPAQILIRWSLQHGYNPLPKSSRPERIKSNAHVYDFVLSDEDMVRLDALDQGADGATSWNPVDVD